MPVLTLGGDLDGGLARPGKLALWSPRRPGRGVPVNGVLGRAKCTFGLNELLIRFSEDQARLPHCPGS